MDYLAKADWISSLLIPSRKAVLTTFSTELRDTSLNWIHGKELG
jgi:hypothetical protein